MKSVRISTDDGVTTAELRGDTVVADDGTRYDRAAVELLAPCEPSALYCLGRNYAGTLEQMDYERPEEPDFFIKPSTSVLAPEQSIPYPTFSDEVTYAGELAAVIRTTCHDVAPEDVPDVVEGYTIMNDVDALDQQGRTARKAFDGSAPLGPCIETDLDPTNLEMRTTIDGEVRQEANTELMLFDPYEAVSFVSERFTLRPGDVVAFGSPPNPGLIEPGNEIEIWYEDIGTLRNTVAEPN